MCQNQTESIFEEFSIHLEVTFNCAKTSFYYVIHFVKLQFGECFINQLQVAPPFSFATNDIIHKRFVSAPSATGTSMHPNKKERLCVCLSVVHMLVLRNGLVDFDETAYALSFIRLGIQN